VLQEETPETEAAQQGSLNGTDAPGAQQLDPEMLEKIAALRTHVHESFGKIALAMVALPRYRHLAIGDLAHLVMEPLIRDRIAIASSAKTDDNLENALAGIAIWASVTEEVDVKIREQIKAGAFPVRLRADEWTGGSINWLLDVIAPNERMATAVIANFKQVIKEGDLRVHPIVGKIVGKETLEKLGAAAFKPMGV
jgi:hemolysin-activating ACP:hemolysin acyltransferase